VNQVAVRCRGTAEHELTLALPDIDVRADLLHGGGVDERPHVRRLVETGSESEILRPRLELLEQRLDHRLLDDHA
jgi:hypothetical protein